MSLTQQYMDYGLDIKHVNTVMDSWFRHKTCFSVNNTVMDSWFRHKTCSLSTIQSWTHGLDIKHVSLCQLMDTIMVSMDSWFRHKTYIFVNNTVMDSWFRHKTCFSVNNTVMDSWFRHKTCFSVNSHTHGLDIKHVWTIQSWFRHKTCFSQTQQYCLGLMV